MHITMTESGFQETGTMLSMIGDRGANLSPVFSDIADKMMAHERELFMSGGASVGRPWKVLDEATIKYKTRKGYAFPDKPLMGSLRLFESLTVRGHQDQILVITDTFLLYGSQVPYSEFLDSGTKDMDERHPIMFTVTQAREYAEDIQDYVFNNRRRRRRLFRRRR